MMLNNRLGIHRRQNRAYKNIIPRKGGGIVIKFMGYIGMYHCKGSGFFKQFILG